MTTHDYINTGIGYVKNGLQFLWKCLFILEPRNIHRRGAWHNISAHLRHWPKDIMKFLE